MPLNHWWQLPLYQVPIGQSARLVSASIRPEQTAGGWWFRDPAAYPAPEQPSRAAPFDASEVAGPPYPAPSPAPVIASHIDEAFAVTLDEERLTLTHASGVTQDFQRLGQ
jgi:hypothetical protein